MEDFINKIRGYFQPKVNTPVPIDQYMGKNPVKTPAETNQVLPGENEWVAMMLNKQTGKTAADLHGLYHQAVKSPGATGNYYNGQKPTATPSPTGQTPKFVNKTGGGQVMGASTAPQAMPTDIPNLKGKNPQQLVQAIEKLYQSRMPQGAGSVEDYYPIAPNIDDIVNRGESIRPGLGVLAALQAFYESTGGRGGGNYWGILPGGEGNPSSGGHVAAMDVNKQMDYLYGPHALGGGANPNMNVANSGDHSPLNVSRIRQLYQSYNPSGDYLPGLLNDYTQVMGGQ